MNTPEFLDGMVRVADGVFSIIILASLAYAVLGLVRPGWAWATKRRWVLARALGLWSAGFVAWAGVIYYTHAHPQGPHSFNRYLKDFSERMHAEHEAARKKCAETGDAAACRRAQSVVPQ